MRKQLQNLLKTVETVVEIKCGRVEFFSCTIVCTRIFCPSNLIKEVHFSEFLFTLQLKRTMDGHCTLTENTVLSTCLEKENAAASF